MEPIGVFTVTSQRTGECYVPDAFKDDLCSMLAALDWAKVWAMDNNMSAAKWELEAIAKHAGRIAELASDFALAAREREEKVA